MFREIESDVVMFLVYRSDNEEAHIYDIAVPPAKAEETEKKLLEIYGTEEFEIFKACVKRL